MKLKHKKFIKQARGFRGRAKNVYSVARNRVEKAMTYSYHGRKLKKRNWRRLWIQQVNAGSRQHDMRYAELIHCLPRSGIELNRKVLAELARTEPYSFKSIVETVKRTGFADFLEARNASWETAHANVQHRIDIVKGRRKPDYPLTPEQREELGHIESDVTERLTQEHMTKRHRELHRLQEYISAPVEGAPWNLSLEEDDKAAEPGYVAPGARRKAIERWRKRQEELARRRETEPER